MMALVAAAAGSLVTEKSILGQASRSTSADELATRSLRKVSDASLAVDEQSPRQAAQIDQVMPLAIVAGTGPTEASPTLLSQIETHGAYSFGLQDVDKDFEHFLWILVPPPKRH
jgi:hypothetical protein